MGSYYAQLCKFWDLWYNKKKGVLLANIKQQYQQKGKTKEENKRSDNLGLYKTVSETMGSRSFINKNVDI
jgi:hypothetical protein